MAVIVVARYLMARDPGFREHLSVSLRHAERSGLSVEDLGLLRLLVGPTDLAVPDGDDT